MLIFLSCASTHNALGDDEDVGNAKDDKGKRGDVDSEEAANLRREQPYISFRSFLVNLQKKTHIVDLPPSKISEGHPEQIVVRKRSKWRFNWCEVVKYFFH